MSKSLIEVEQLRARIYTIRGMKVMLDRDLAEFYGVETKYLKKQVNRNSDRFPEDFMFQLNEEEFRNWRFQNVTSKSDKMGLRYAPYAFSEQGVAMLSGVLRSKKAVDINIKIMRAFVELRQLVAAKPEYELLKETIKRIESDIKIESKLVSGKIAHLSQKVQMLSDLFDTFQDAHIVVKRPVDGIGEG